MPLPPASPRVLVVGGGPVGMAAGFLLEKLYGVPTRVVERQARPTTHPQAHFLNLRTMEVLYATMPAFHDRLLEHAAPSHLVRPQSVRAHSSPSIVLTLRLVLTDGAVARLYLLHGRRQEPRVRARRPVWTL